jgi:hypothetical protein
MLYISFVLICYHFLIAPTRASLEFVRPSNSSPFEKKSSHEVLTLRKHWLHPQMERRQSKTICFVCGLVGAYELSFFLPEKVTILFQTSFFLFPFDKIFIAPMDTKILILVEKLTELTLILELFPIILPFHTLHLTWLIKG